MIPAQYVQQVERFIDVLKHTHKIKREFRNTEPSRISDPLKVIGKRIVNNRQQVLDDDFHDLPSMP